MSEYSSTQRNIISKMGKIGQWDDPVAIYNKFVNAGKDSPNDVEGQVYTLYRTRHTISKLRPAFVSSQYNITHFVWMHKEDITCLIDDTDKPKLRALTLNGMVQEYGINKKVLVFRQNNEKHMETFEYIKLLKNYKSGGYYNFSSKDLEQYLNYKLTKEYGQPRIFECSRELF